MERRRGMGRKGKRAIVIAGVGLLAISALFFADRLTRWISHARYLTHFPEVAPPEGCSLASSGFCESFWRIPFAVHLPPTPGDTAHGCPPEYSPAMDYGFLWFTCQSEAGKGELALMRTLEDKLAAEHWHLDNFELTFTAGSFAYSGERPVWMSDGDIPKEQQVGLFDGRVVRGRVRGYLAFPSDRGLPYCNLRIIVVSWREGERVMMQVTGHRLTRYWSG